QPATDEAIQAKAPAPAPPAADEAPIALPPPPQAPVETPEVDPRFLAALTRLDWALAGLVLVLAFLLGSFAVRNSDFWMHLATVGTLLALLAVSTRYFLQPTMVSYLFLGLTLYLLTRDEGKTNAAGAPRHLWLLPPLFALWVNLDAWFFLGPLCVGLYLLGT